MVPETGLPRSARANSIGIEKLDAAEAVFDEELRTIDVVRGEAGVRRAAREFDPVAGLVDDATGFVAVARQDALARSRCRGEGRR